MPLDREELMRLREQLRSIDPVQRESATRRLISLVEASAPSLLLEALASDTAEVRDQALLLIERMAESGDPGFTHVAESVRGVGPGA